MKLPGVIVAVFLLTGAIHVNCTLGRGLSTPEERAKVVALTRALEREPISATTPASRHWLRQWVVEVPDITVYTCDALLGHGVRPAYPYLRELNLQAMFSAAAFAIEHPYYARDRIAQFRAGVEGALRAYEALVKSRPDAKSASLDELVAKRDRGELVDHVASLAKERCKKPNTIVNTHLAGAGVGLLLGLLVARWFRGRRVTGFRGAILQRIVFVCAAYYVIALVVLHILGPEFDPRFNYMSAYALGPYGWLMTTTFFVLGLAAFVVALGLRHVHQSSRSARVGFGLLTIAALGVCLAGVFKDSIPHFFAGAVAFPSIVMALLLFSWSFRRAPGWRTIYPAMLVMALGMLAAFVSMVADVGMPGLQQRVFILLFLVWLSVIAHRLVVHEQIFLNSIAR
jgi:hypothetical membrane protein